MYNKLVHPLTTMMNTTMLTATAFKRKNPATAALEEALRVDDLLIPMQRKRRRQSLEGDSCNSSKSNPYGMLGIWRETEKLDQSCAFPTIEWSFDDDTSVVSERGSPCDDDECIQSWLSPNTACLAPAALQKSSSRLLSKKSSKSNSLRSLKWMPELSSREERNRSFLHSLAPPDHLKPPSRAA